MFIHLTHVGKMEALSKPCKENLECDVHTASRSPLARERTDSKSPKKI